jgi:hypothetical protein
MLKIATMKASITINSGKNNNYDYLSQKDIYSDHYYWEDSNSKNFQLRNLENFKYVLFRCEGDGDNYKNRRVYIHHPLDAWNNSSFVIEFPNDDGRFGELYVPVEQIISYINQSGGPGLNVVAEWRETTNLPKCKLDIYLTLSKPN